MAFYPKKRSYGAAFGRRPRRGFRKPAPYRKRARFARPSSAKIIKCHLYGTVSVDPGSANDLTKTIKISDLNECETFKRFAATHERFSVKSMYTKFCITGTAAPMALSMVSKDDELDASTDVNYYLRHSTVMNHDLTIANKTCGRGLSVRDLGQLSSDKIPTNMASSVLGGTSYMASQKIIVPGTKTLGAAMSFYTTISVMMYGDQDLSTTQYDALTSGF